LSPDEVRILEGELSGDFKGIGIKVQFAPESKGARVNGFANESPAKEAGLRVGDVITEVDETSVHKLNLTQVSSLIRGHVNTTVKLGVSREGVPDFEVSVPRREIKMPRVRCSLVGPETTYIGIEGLVGAVAEDLSEALSESRAKNARKLILDLRGKAGSSLQTATDVAALFLPEGTLIVTIRERNKERPILAEGPVLWEGPMVALVDNRTISGGELIAAALQGAGRAVIIGESTPGKGSVQTVYKVAQDYAVQLTTGVLAGPNGLLYNKFGVEPDIEVDGAEASDYLLNGEDIGEDMMVRVARESLDRDHEKAGN
jgi:carboxyl-terminal processing protease